MPLPAGGKPIRGRGSHGVKVCHDIESLRQHLSEILQESPKVMVERVLPGQEVTVTVMRRPDQPDRWQALSVVERFDHEQDIAPYSGRTAVTANSCLVPATETRQDRNYRVLKAHCLAAAQFLGVTAPIRIDARRVAGKNSKFALFDVNMKPVRCPPKMSNSIR